MSSSASTAAVAERLETEVFEDMLKVMGVESYDQSVRSSTTLLMI